MNEELNLMSIGDLPVIEGLADGDYLLTVSGGKGKLLPAGNFSGGASLTTYNMTTADMSTFTIVDEAGAPITDFEAVWETLAAGPVIFKVEADDGVPFYFNYLFAFHQGVGIVIGFFSGSGVGMAAIGEGIME